MLPALIQRSNKVPLNILRLLQATCMFRKLRLVLSNNPKYCLLFPGPPWGRGNKLHKHTETTRGTIIITITVIKNKTKKNSHLLIATHKWVIIWLCGHPKETFLNEWTCSQECSSSGITVSSVLVRPKYERAQRPIIHWTHSLSTLIIHRRKKKDIQIGKKILHEFSGLSWSMLIASVGGKEESAQQSSTGASAIGSVINHDRDTPAAPRLLPPTLSSLWLTPPPHSLFFPSLRYILTREAKAP